MTHESLLNHDWESVVARLGGAEMLNISARETKAFLRPRVIEDAVDRVRELVRNNPLAAKAARVLSNNVVGTGIEAQARTGDPLDQKINSLWAEFVTECDFGEQVDLYGVQRLAVPR